jgi:7,8-dihydroneopterin aldolase/epimerase/oxygenase
MLGAMTGQWPLSEALGLRRLLERAGGSSYRVTVSELELSASIGIYDHERQQRQRVRIDVDLDVVDPGAFAGEEFAQVLNYETIVEGAKAIVAAGHIELVETLAERVASLCLADPRAVDVTVKVQKLDVYPETKGVGVVIIRRKPQ